MGFRELAREPSFGKCPFVFFCFFFLGRGGGGGDCEPGLQDLRNCGVRFGFQGLTLDRLPQLSSNLLGGLGSNGAPKNISYAGVKFGVEPLLSLFLALPLLSCSNSHHDQTMGGY